MKLLLYCTKGKPYLIHESGDYDCNDISCSYDCYSVVDKQYLNDEGINALNGKIVAECDYEVEEIKRINTVGDWFCYENQEEIMEKSKIDVNKFFGYLQGKNGYAIHIENLHIFDEPTELSDYLSYITKNEFPELDKPIEKAPQNMMYCYIDDGDDEYYNSGNEAILISIRPEWLCKILNGEKTIEIRKKVLKGMLEK